ncbi:MAG: hypothetical protein ACRECV_02030 [Xanthobacteraceae bacterium]
MPHITEIDLNDYSSGPNWLSPKAQREAKRLEHIKRLREAAEARRKARRESIPPDPVPPADEPGEPEPPSDDPDDPSPPADA